MEVWPGTPYPLGATWDGSGVNFALFSENATGVDVNRDFMEAATPEGRALKALRDKFGWSRAKALGLITGGMDFSVAVTLLGGAPDRLHERLVQAHRQVGAHPHAVREDALRVFIQNELR